MFNVYSLLRVLNSVCVVAVLYDVNSFFYFYENYCMQSFVRNNNMCKFLVEFVFSFCNLKKKNLVVTYQGMHRFFVCIIICFYLE